MIHFISVTIFMKSSLHIIFPYLISGAHGRIHQFYQDENNQWKWKYFLKKWINLFVTIWTWEKRGGGVIWLLHQINFDYHFVTLKLLETALAEFQLMQDLHWFLTNWFKALTTDLMHWISLNAMPALDQFELIQCLHCISLNWFNACIGPVWND